MKTSQYFLDGGEELDRLQLQAKVWEKEAEGMLDAIGVEIGWRCLDLGCGAVGILGPLSRRVGDTGRVVGVDQDSSLLDAARAHIQQTGLKNVELVLGDAQRSGLPADSFDMVHERFVLPHVVSPEDTLKEMTASRNRAA